MARAQIKAGGPTRGRKRERRIGMGSGKVLLRGRRKTVKRKPK
jgi:hypothetical protein